MRCGYSNRCCHDLMVNDCNDIVIFFGNEECWKFIHILQNNNTFIKYNNFKVRNIIKTDKNNIILSNTTFSKGLQKKK